MSTIAQAADLLKQAQSFEDSADALSPRIADGQIALGDRQQLFTQSSVLRSQAFTLRTQVANAIVKDLQVDVALLQGQIDAAKSALARIAKVKSLIDLASGLAGTATAIATGQPAGIATALASLQQTVASVKGA